MWDSSSGGTGGPWAKSPQIDISLLSAYGVDESILGIWAKSYPKLLPIQSRAVAEFGLFSGENLLIFSPTSSGKTFVGEMAAVAAAKHKKRAFYLLPLKSLAEEKFEEFSRRYGQIGLKTVVSSHDRREYDKKIEKGDFDIAIVVFEKMDSLLVARPTLLENIGLVVIDEMQMLSDATRGPRLELLLSKILAFAPKTQIIGLSAVLQKSQDIRNWIGARLLEDHTRPVELRKGVFCKGTFYYVLHNEGSEGQEQFDIPLEGEAPTGQAVLGLVKELAHRNEQCLVFLRDKTSTIEMARRFAEHSKLAPAEATLSELRGLGEQSNSKELLVFFASNGVAFHNADLSFQQRRVIENGFRMGEIRVLFSTTTLGMGINLPAKNVIIDEKRWRFSKEFKQMHLADISRAEYENLGGRAGRLSLEPQFGRSILVTSSEFDVKRLMEIYVKGSFEEAVPRLSEMPLEDVVLNILASHLAQTEPELSQFLLGTYTGRNLWAKAQTPTLQAARSKFERDLGDSVQSLLNGALLAQGPGGKLLVTELGKTVSKSCILARTGLGFAHWAKDNRGAIVSPLEVLILIASSRDALSVFVPLSRSEWQDDRYLNALRQAATAFAALDKPIISQLVDPNKRPSFEQTRAIKRALLMLDFLEETPLSDLEEKYYNTWPGLIQRIGEADSWLCEALGQICQLYNWPAARLKECESLKSRLSFGVMEDMLPLARHLALRLSRPEMRRLVNSGIRSLKRLKSSSTEQLAELIGLQAARSLASTFGLKASIELDVRRSESKPQTGNGERRTENVEALELLCIDARDMSVRYRDVELNLRPKAFKLLLVLAKNAPQFARKEEIYRALWGSAHPDSFPYERQISDHKGRLKKAMLDAARACKSAYEEDVRGLLVSKYGVGYRLALPQEKIKIMG